jgi:NAD(P)-dependent dehydrogenase (short-subunit alcohol dehydrogenase family)
MNLQINGKTALVTGATAGIGLEIARKLAQEGAQVTVTGRSQTKLDQAVRSVRASGGAAVRGVLADAVTAEGTARGRVLRHGPAVLADPAHDRAGGGRQPGGLRGEPAVLGHQWRRPARRRRRGAHHRLTDSAPRLLPLRREYT